MKPVLPSDGRLPERFRSKVAVSETGCWLWTGATGRDGYSRYRYGGKGSKTGVAHRFAYENLIGPIPAGMQLDHLCRIRNCVNPAHLEPVSPRENTLRGVTLAAANAAKTQCPSGHPYDDQNTFVDAKRRIRMCRACASERMRIRRREAKRKEYSMRPILVTTEHRGVFAGLIEDDQDINARSMPLKSAKMAIYWGTTKGVLELAKDGPNSKSKISLAADIPALHGITAVFDVTPEAWKKWEAA